MCSSPSVFVFFTFTWHTAPRKSGSFLLLYTCTNTGHLDLSQGVYSGHLDLSQGVYSGHLDLSQGVYSGHLTCHEVCTNSGHFFSFRACFRNGQFRFLLRAV